MGDLSRGKIKRIGAVFGVFPDNGGGQQGGKRGTRRAIQEASRSRFGIVRVFRDRWMAIGLRRGLLRIWLLLSAGWIMSWVIGLIVGLLEHGFKTSGFLVIPVLLFAPPVALLIFGFGAGWAVRGFKVDESPSEK
jgi:hypothetical protein